MPRLAFSQYYLIRFAHRITYKKAQAAKPLSQHSSSQCWLYIGITLESFSKFWCQSLTPDQFIRTAARGTQVISGDPEEQPRESHCPQQSKHLRKAPCVVITYIWRWSIHSLSKCLMSIYYVMCQALRLGIRGRAENKKSKSLPSWGWHCSRGNQQQ